MANTFKVFSYDAMPAGAGTPEALYTVAGSTTTIVNSLVISNIHTADVTVDVKLVSDTGSRGGDNNVTNTTSFLLNDVSVPTGSSIDVLHKQVLETGDVLQVSCSTADKVSVTLSVLEIT